MNGCVPGELITTSGLCELCPPTKYSLVENAEICKTCVAGGYCPGKDVILLELGYWRPHNMTGNIYFYYIH